MLNSHAKELEMKWLYLRLYKIFRIIQVRIICKKNGVSPEFIKGINMKTLDVWIGGIRYNFEPEFQSH